jgi:hypothetical protein
MGRRRLRDGNESSDLLSAEIPETRLQTQQQRGTPGESSDGFTLAPGFDLNA